MTTHTMKQKQQLQRKITQLKMNNRIKVLKLDITNSKDRNIIDSIDIDVLFAHAGVGEGSAILDLPIDKLKNNYDVNIFSNIELIKRYIKKQNNNKKKGKVIVTSSIAGVIPIPYLGSYASSKAALSMIIKTMNKELKNDRSKVKVYLVEPGAYKTGFNQVMIDKIENYSNIKNQFKIHKLFDLIECKKINTVIKKMLFLAENNSIKLVHRVPLLQRIFTKLYLIIFG